MVHEHQFPCVLKHKAELQWGSEWLFLTAFQLQKDGIKLGRKLNSTLFPKEAQPLHRGSLRCSWMKQAKGGLHKKPQGRLLCFQRSRRIGDVLWEVLVYYWALCTGPSGWQIQTDQIDWKIRHCWSDCTVEVSKQHSERIIRRTLPLVLKHFWPESFLRGVDQGWWLLMHTCSPLTISVEVSDRAAVRQITELSCKSMKQLF